MVVMETSSSPIKNSEIGMHVIPLNEVMHLSESEMKDMSFQFSHKCVNSLLVLASYWVKPVC
jgi:hypothetical protein